MGVGVKGSLHVFRAESEVNQPLQNTSNKVNGYSDRGSNSIILPLFPVGIAGPRSAIGRAPDS